MRGCHATTSPNCDDRRALSRSLNAHYRHGARAPCIRPISGVSAADLCSASRHRRLRYRLITRGRRSRPMIPRPTVNRLTAGRSVGRSVGRSIDRSIGCPVSKARETKDTAGIHGVNGGEVGGGGGTTAAGFRNGRRALHRAREREGLI